jgi:hypothetical protein
MVDVWSPQGCLGSGGCFVPNHPLQHHRTHPSTIETPLKSQGYSRTTLQNTSVVHPSSPVVHLVPCACGEWMVAEIPDGALYHFYYSPPVLALSCFIHSSPHLLKVLFFVVFLTPVLRPSMVMKSSYSPTTEDPCKKCIVFTPASICCPHLGGRLFCFTSPGSLTAFISTINILNYCWLSTVFRTLVIFVNSYIYMTPYFLGFANKAMYKSR